LKPNKISLSFSCFLYPATNNIQDKLASLIFASKYKTIMLFLSVIDQCNCNGKCIISNCFSQRNVSFRN